MISLEKQFLFIHVPKTAGNALQNVLKDYSEDTITATGEHQDGLERFEVASAASPRLRKHSTLAEYVAVYGRRTIDPLFRFSVIRHPWDRLVSFYFFAQESTAPHWDRQGFIEFVAGVKPANDFYLRGRLDRWLHRDGRRNLDGVIRFENLEGDFASICGQIGIPAANLPVRNRGAGGDYAQYYDAELGRLVAQRFAADFRLGDYALPPAG